MNLMPGLNALKLVRRCPISMSRQWLAEAHLALSSWCTTSETGNLAIVMAKENQSDDRSTGKSVCRHALVSKAEVLRPEVHWQEAGGTAKARKVNDS